MWDRRYTSCQVMVNVVSEDGLANATKGKIGHVKEEVLYRNLDRSEWGEWPNPGRVREVLPAPRSPH